MKKLISFAMAIMLILICSACYSAPSYTADNSETTYIYTPSPSPTPTPKTGDTVYDGSKSHYTFEVTDILTKDDGAVIVLTVTWKHYKDRPIAFDSFFSGADVTAFQKGVKLDDSYEGTADSDNDLEVEKGTELDNIKIAFKLRNTTDIVKITFDISMGLDNKPKSIYINPNTCDFALDSEY